MPPPFPWEAEANKLEVYEDKKGYWVQTSDHEMRNHARTEAQLRIVKARRYFDTIGDVHLRADYEFGNLPYERRLIDSLLIQTYGKILYGNDRCECCKKGNGMYAECTRLSGEFGGACGNCKRGDRGARCDVRDPGPEMALDKDEEMEMVERTVNRNPSREPRTCRRIEDGKERKYPK